MKIPQPNAGVNKGLTAPLTAQVDHGHGHQHAVGVLKNLGRGKSVFAGAPGAQNNLKHASVGSPGGAMTPSATQPPDNFGWRKQAASPYPAPANAGGP